MPRNREISLDCYENTFFPKSSQLNTYFLHIVFHYGLKNKKMRQISPKDKALRDYAAGVTVTFDGMALVGWMGGCRYKSDRLLLRTNGQSDGRTFGPISNLIGHHHANCSSKSKLFFIQRWRHRSLVYVKWKLQPLKVAM